MEMMHDFGGNVISLVQKAGANNLQASFPAIAQVDAYWEGLRAGRLMPERAEVDPRGIEDALEFAFMLERVAPGVGRLRIAGMHLNDLLGMEVRGMPLSALFDPASRARISEIVENVLHQPQVADIKLKSDRGIGRSALTARLYLAPLGNGGHGFPRLLGCLQSEGRIGRAPRRFTIDQIHARRIVSAGRTIETPDTDSLPNNSILSPQEFADPAVIFKHAKRQEILPQMNTRPKLRLVKSEE